MPRTHFSGAARSIAARATSIMRSRISPAPSRSRRRPTAHPISRAPTAAAPSPPLATIPSRPAAPAPGSVNPQANQIKQLLDQGNYAAAIERLNQLLAADPHDETALRARALSY